MNYPKKTCFNPYQSQHCTYITYSVKTWFLKNLSVCTFKLYSELEVHIDPSPLLTVAIALSLNISCLTVVVGDLNLFAHPIIDIKGLQNNIDLYREISCSIAALMIYMSMNINRAQYSKLFGKKPGSSIRKKALTEKLRSQI